MFIINGEIKFACVVNTGGLNRIVTEVHESKLF